MNAVALLAQQDSPDLVGGLLSLMCVYSAIGLLASVFWLWMLVDAVVYEPTTNDKILWFLIIFFLHLIGAILYFVVRRRNRTNRF